MNNKKTFYLSTSIAYTSGKPHIGNTYEIVLADSIVRFKRNEGYDVYFQTGTDEHGEKIQIKAKEAGKTPKEFVDDVSTEIKDIWNTMNTSYDKFVRTTDEYHEKQIQKIFKKLYKQDDIYKGHYEGWYCTPCESFFTESQLADKKCPDCGREVKLAKEEAYFFRLSKYQDRIIKHIEENPDFIQPESRKNEMLNNFLKPGLQDLCVSRTSFDWGIPVDFDNKHVVYVWIDALSNYITGLGYDVDGNSDKNYNKYWPADVHLVGKDIIRFHTIYWPAMLMALGEVLPKKVFGHPWIIVGDGKMSKSKGNTIYADDLVRYFGRDAVRYFVLHEIPFSQDGVLTYELMIERINSDLANNLGNLVNRTITMVKKYFDGTVYKPVVKESVDDELIKLALDTHKRVVLKMNELKVSDAIDEIFILLKRSNKYIDETTPWVLGKDESGTDRLKTVLYNLLESIRIAATLIQAFLPETSERIFKMLNIANPGFESLDNFYVIPEGTKVSEPEVLFARIDEKEKLKEIEVENPKVTEAKAEPQNLIKYDDFAKVDLKVGEVLACEKVEGSDKLLKSQIKMGNETRQIVSGIASFYKPEEMVGKKVVVVTNLEPAKIRGVLSEGMILAAGDGKKMLSVLEVDSNVESGEEVK